MPKRQSPGPVTVSVFKGARAPFVASEVTSSWPEFVEGVRDVLATTAADKLDLPALVPCAFANGHRSNASAGDHTALLIDVDAVPDPVAFLAACERLTCVVYESPSSTDDAPRFRVAAALAEPYPAHAVPAARAELARALGLDPDACGTNKAGAIAQLFFCGRVEGTRERALWAFDGGVWVPSAPGEAPAVAELERGEPSEPIYGPERVPDLSCLTPHIEPDPADPLGMRRGGRDVSRALGGYLARKGYHPLAIAEAVFQHVPSSRPDERAAQAQETAEQFYDGDPRAAGYTTLADRFGADVVAELDKAIADPWVDAWAARRLAGPPPLPAPPKAQEVPARDALGAFPSWVQEHVLAAREELRTPLDLNLANALGVLSSAVQGKLRARIHRTYACHTCLFVCSVAPPGELKSPSFRLATAPIKAWERERQEQEAVTVQTAQIERARLEAEKKRLEKDHARSYGQDDGPEAKDLLAIRLKLEQPPPVPFEYLVEDCTPEALANLLATHGRIAAFSSDASKVFRVMAGRYSDGQADLGAWLEAYDGGMPKVHRIGREAAKPRHSQTTLAAVLSIQPQVLETITGNAALVGEGLVQRFCWVVCAQQGPRWARGEVPTPVPADVTEAYETGVRRLLEIPTGTEVRLSPEAHAVYVAWRDELEDRIHHGDLGDDLSGWTSKHLERTARVAAILWAADGCPGKEITEDHMQRACLVGRWLIPHATRALRGADADEQEKRLLAFVAKRSAEAGQAIPKREILQRGPRAWRSDGKRLTEKLENLVERGLLELVGKSYRVAGAGAEHRGSEAAE
jgi:replicative DNA helicase